MTQSLGQFLTTYYLRQENKMRRETKDGKYYMYGEYSNGIPKVRYSIGRCTEQGDQHIEDVLGYREARAFLKDLILKTGEN